MITTDEKLTSTSSRKNSSPSIQMRTQKITQISSFLTDCASTEQAYMVLDFITEHLDRIEKPKADKTRFYKPL